MTSRIAAFVSVAIAPAIALHACDRLATMTHDSECVVDDDCGLMPLITCCGECEPVPPFEAVPRSAIDARLVELETYCAERTIECEPPTCDVAPPGCVARAACVHGTCRVIESGCGDRIAITR